MHVERLVEKIEAEGGEAPTGADDRFRRLTSADSPGLTTTGHTGSYREACSLGVDR